MKNKVLLYIGICMLSAACLGGCGNSNDDYDESELQQMEGYEGMSDEEINKKLIEEADKMEVLPDKTQ
ncbi:MAG: hypothetical protein IJ711_06275 [Lachnospiraceae bacterium]|nr:hypothetical protein [Lachnospiraceae bacterium]